MSDLQITMRARAGTILVAASGVLLLISLVLLAGSLSGGGAEQAEAAAQKEISSLRTKVEKAEGDLADQHEKLLSELPGADYERVQRDEAKARSLLLALTGTSSSTRTVPETQGSLDARYEELGPDSRALTEFVPAWMSATGASQGRGTVYRLADLDIEVAGISGLDYSYVALATMEPVTAGKGDPGPREYVVLTFSTAEDGTVTSVDAYRTATKSRDDLVSEAEDADRDDE